MAETQTQTVYNPQKFDIGLEAITIGNTEYIIGDWNKSDNVNTVDSTDSKGVYRGSAYTEGKKSASATLRKITNTDATPTKWQTFEYDGEKWVIESVSQAKAPNTESTYSITCAPDKSAS